MELEFDKEIDAILRKARVGGVAAVRAVDSPHVDADAIAAFAENVLPDKAKRLYMAHFADCDPCRRMLSQTMTLISEADVTAAPSVAKDPVSPVLVTWYERLFRTPNLAAAMGALVLTFSGILGYMVFQRPADTAVGDQAKAAKPQSPAVVPNFNRDVSTNSSSSAANASAANTAAAANVASDDAVPQPERSGNIPSGGPSPDGEPEERRSEISPAATPATEPARPIVSAPPAPAASQPVPSDDEKKAEKDADKLKDRAADAAMSKTDAAGEDVARNDAPKAAKKPSTGGPRNVQMQQETNLGAGNGVVENSATKQAGGKNFVYRNGVWYDRTYHGEATTNVKRGSDEFKKLDSTLRKIAGSIGGTIVVVSKEKAYRIQ